MRVLACTGASPRISQVRGFPASASCAARIIGAIKGVFVVAIAQCRGYCARIGVAPRFRAVGLVDWRSMEDVSRSGAVAVNLHEGSRE